MADIFVGNLSCELTEQDLRREFQAFGEVREVSINQDRKARQSRTFGFVKMPVDLEARAAAAGLKGKELCGRRMRVVYIGPEIGSAGMARGKAAPTSKEWGSHEEW
jgi:RNA recognition motif-containing protein